MLQTVDISMVFKGYAEIVFLDNKTLVSQRITSVLRSAPRLLPGVTNCQVDQGAARPAPGRLQLHWEGAQHAPRLPQRHRARTEARQTRLQIRIRSPITDATTSGTPKASQSRRMGIRDPDLSSQGPNHAGCETKQLFHVDSQ